MKIVKHVEINCEFQVGNPVYFFNDSCYAECPYCDKTAKVTIKGKEFECPCCGADGDEGYAHIDNLIDYKPRLVEGIVTNIELVNHEEDIIMTVRTPESFDIVMFGNIHGMDDDKYVDHDFGNNDDDFDFLTYVCSTDKGYIEQRIEDFIKKLKKQLTATMKGDMIRLFLRKDDL